MASTLTADVKSLIGSSASDPKPVPKVGEKAPLLDEGGASYTNGENTGRHLIAFVRHCGCPFAEKEVRQLADIHAKYPHVRITIVSHSEQDVVQDWFNRIGKPHFNNLENVDVRADPTYSSFNAFGIGQLGWTQLFTRETFSLLKNLASEGIKNTPTGKGSNRWQNSGGFAIDANGIVRWAKVAKEAADVCNYQDAVQTIV